MIKQKSINVGILTLPFKGNYGGILQTYALQVYLKRLGYNAIHIYRDFPETNKLTQIAKDIAKFLIGKTIRIQIKRRYTFRFFDKYVSPRTKKIRTLSDFRTINKHQLSTIIVGSDQVWRKSCIYGALKTNYFLDFANDNINKIAYAASFGIDSWQFDEGETKIIRELVRKFSAVSVREESGYKLCREYLGVEAKHVIDPVMLLSAKDYIDLVELGNEKKHIGDCLVYMLDHNNEKQTVIDNIIREFNYQPYTVNKEIAILGMRAKPSVTSWLRGFYDAKFVITDSFHGCVFSIIFNKPFVVIGNVNRGLARFTSILKEFGLTDRMILNDRENYSEIVRTPINWVNTNETLDKKRHEAYLYLTSSIK
jgi:hypothetical protein